MAGGPAPLVDDDLATVGDWRFTPAEVVPRVLFMHGAEDRVIPSAHGAWLAARAPAPS
jgi:pimeloyl-ACP methyl ester carboxylesterase